MSHIVGLSVAAWLNDGNLSGADLRWANLREADLRMANLEGANFTGADMAGTILPHGYLAPVLQAEQNP